MTRLPVLVTWVHYVRLWGTSGARGVTRGLRRILARVRGVLGAPPPKSSTVASSG